MHYHAAQMGMGGVTTVFSPVNAHTIFYNPALLNRQSFSFEISALQIGIGTDAADIFEFIADHQDEFNSIDETWEEDPEKLDEFVKDSEKFDNKWQSVNVSPFVGLVIGNFSVGVYNVAQADVKLDQGIFIPAIGARGYSDTVVGVGFGKTISAFFRDWELGVTARYYQRRTLTPQRVNANDAEDGGKLAETVQDDLEDPTSGFGIDVGMVQTFEFLGRDIDVGVVIQDLIGSQDGWVKPNLKFGALYQLPWKNILVKRWDFAVEYEDFFNRTGTSAFQHVNMGTELSILAGFLKFRGGLHQGYPTFGAGVSFLVFKLDAAYYTRELGTAPGMEPEETYRAQFSIQF